MAKKIILVIHGGAGNKSADPKLLQKRRISLASILNQSFILLKKGASAVDVTSEAVRLLENDSLFNAGRGSKIQQDGKIRMSASLMNGEKLRFAGCINVTRVKNPILLAKKLLSEEDRVLEGAGALLFAKQNKMQLSSPYTKAARQQFLEKISSKTGTVGAVALDLHGQLAAATSTGGRGFEFPHRVSDSATVAGNYANRFGAFSATGIGEEIVEAALCARIAAFMEAGHSLEKAGKLIIADAKKRGFQFGFIGLDRFGHSLTMHTTPSMCWGSITRTELVVVP